MASAHPESTQTQRTQQVRLDQDVGLHISYGAQGRTASQLDTNPAPWCSKETTSGPGRVQGCFSKVSTATTGPTTRGSFPCHVQGGGSGRTALKFLQERDEPRIPMLKQPHFGQSPGNPWWLTPSHKFSVDKQCLDGPSQRSHLSLCIHQPRSAQAERAWGSRDQCAGLILCKSLVFLPYLNSLTSGRRSSFFMASTPPACHTDISACTCSTSYLLHRITHRASRVTHYAPWRSSVVHIAGSPSSATPHSPQLNPINL